MQADGLWETNPTIADAFTARSLSPTIIRCSTLGHAVIVRRLSNVAGHAANAPTAMSGFARIAHLRDALIHDQLETVASGWRQLLAPGDSVHVSWDMFCAN